MKLLHLLLFIIPSTVVFAQSSYVDHFQRTFISSAFTGLNSDFSFNLGLRNKNLSPSIQYNYQDSLGNGFSFSHCTNKNIQNNSLIGYAKQISIKKGHFINLGTQLSNHTASEKNLTTNNFGFNLGALYHNSNFYIGVALNNIFIQNQSIFSAQIGNNFTFKKIDLIPSYNYGRTLNKYNIHKFNFKLKYKVIELSMGSQLSDYIYFGGALNLSKFSIGYERINTLNKLTLALYQNRNQLKITIPLKSSI